MTKPLARSPEGGSLEKPRKWCSKCGALPASGVRPRVAMLNGRQSVLTLPCSVEGCEGRVSLTGEEFVLLQKAHLVTHVGDALLTLRKVRNQSLVDMDSADDVQDRMTAARLARATAIDELRLADVAPAESTGPVVSFTQNFGVDPGDSIDRRLDAMFEGKGVIDISPGVKVAPGVPPPSPVEEEDDGGWA